MCIITMMCIYCIPNQSVATTHPLEVLTSSSNGGSIEGEWIDQYIHYQYSNYIHMFVSKFQKLEVNGKVNKVNS